MPANITPIYSRVPDIQWVESMTVANNTIDLTTGTTYTIFTSDATNGGYVSRIVIKIKIILLYTGRKICELRVYTIFAVVLKEIYNSPLIAEVNKVIIIQGQGCEIFT